MSCDHLSQNHQLEFVWDVEISIYSVHAIEAECEDGVVFKSVSKYVLFILFYLSLLATRFVIVVGHAPFFQMWRRSWSIQLTQ